MIIRFIIAILTVTAMASSSFAAPPLPPDWQRHGYLINHTADSVGLVHGDDTSWFSPSSVNLAGERVGIDGSLDLRGDLDIGGLLSVANRRHWLPLDPDSSIIAFAYHTYDTINAPPLLHHGGMIIDNTAYTMQDGWGPDSTWGPEAFLAADSAHHYAAKYSLHPAVKYRPDNYLGYRWWYADGKGTAVGSRQYTRRLLGDGLTDREYVCLYASRDGLDFEAPTVTNGVDSFPMAANPVLALRHCTGKIDTVWYTSIDDHLDSTVVQPSLADVDSFHYEIFRPDLISDPRLLIMPNNDLVVYGRVRHSWYRVTSTLDPWNTRWALPIASGSYNKYVVWARRFLYDSSMTVGNAVWTDARIVLDTINGGNRQNLSPALWRDGPHAVSMLTYDDNSSTFSLYRADSANGDFALLLDSVPFSLPPQYAPWHHDVIPLGRDYLLGLFSCKAQPSHPALDIGQGTLNLGFSTDHGHSWTIGRELLAPSNVSGRPDSADIYASSGYWRVGAGETVLDLYYGCQAAPHAPTDSSGLTWRVMRSQIHFRRNRRWYPLDVAGRDVIYDSAVLLGPTIPAGMDSLFLAKDSFTTAATDTFALVAWSLDPDVRYLDTLRLWYRTHAGGADSSFIEQIDMFGPRQTSSLADSIYHTWTDLAFAADVDSLSLPIHSDRFPESADIWFRVITTADAPAQIVTILKARLLCLLE